MLTTQNMEFIGVFVQGFFFLKPYKYMINPVITISLVNCDSGMCIARVNCTNLKDIMISSTMSFGQHDIYGRPDSALVRGPFFLEEKMSALDSENTMLMFEVSEASYKNNSERKRLAWAFLVPNASDGSKNTNKNVKLQLYEIRRRCKISHQTCNIYHLYKDHSFKKIQGALVVKVKGILRVNNEEKQLATSNLNREEINDTATEEPKSVEIRQILKCSRLPTQSCKIPNNIHKTLNLSYNGSSCVQFNQSGTHLAVSTAHRILIYDVISGSKLMTLNGHNGFIYGLDWSEGDCHLLSVSNDCTCIVWNIVEKTLSHVLPHPSFVYCGKWLTMKKLVTSCRDHVIRYWVDRGEGFELVQEILGHSGFVTSLALQDFTTLISGDSNGCIVMHVLRDGKWKIIKQLELKETSRGIIDMIHVCGGSSRVIITSRSKGSFMVDLKPGIITQKYKGVFNVILRFASCLTPCGSLFFAFCQNGEVNVWNSHTGKHIASYECLFTVEGLSEICGCIHYNPVKHMIAIGALDHNYPVFLLKFEEKNDSKRIGLVRKCDEDDTHF